MFRAWLLVEVPAEPVERIVDTTGAGDLFAAGFLAGRADALADGVGGEQLLERQGAHVRDHARPPSYSSCRFHQP